MANFLDSPLINNLTNGTLPEVKVNIETQSIINLCIGVVLSGVIIVLVWTIVKNRG